MEIQTSRRGLLALGAGAVAVIATACGKTADRAAPSVGAVEAWGEVQAGITRPALPQSQMVSQVYGINTAPGPLLHDLGGVIDTLTHGSLEGVEPPGDLTVTVGIGPRLVRMAGSDLPGADDLPAFAREQIHPDFRGGDLWAQICGTDALAVGMAAVTIREHLGSRATLRWQQRGWRGQYQPTPDGNQAGRNLQGFQDGIVNPRTRDELGDGVWLAAPSQVANGTIAVVRRFRMDLDAWRALGIAGQERAVGRSKVSSMSLSGGPNIDLGAKNPDGSYRIPADAHARRANPLDTGVPKMLRRSYSIDDPEPGLLFVSFQNTLRAFTMTMRRLVESDRMIATTTSTATGTFLVLPGVTADRALGSTLFG